ncbi:YbfB/YjiJ family MFS transporter [Texcoconibacillus texcoconensis]|uniref:MFS family permease n=1 Tax=Texcoconibacillus texcoconensis TaxID=1095777 RepID=A0A840QUB5_9BACI|nr:YbfB/YjiJ family MFS transporter [Texcoconibacillus texcoconensis]MBB5175122.1 MFS family permease [Texcoconibacillus texcoconensis]
MLKITNPFFIAIIGMLSLAIVMGIGRFAYTPLLPYMEEENLTPLTAGVLATTNYIGYFLGAYGARNIVNRQKAFYTGLWINILTTTIMGLTEFFSLWLILRLISGVTSGLVFVLVSSIILDKLNKSNRLGLSGFFYGGVGLGIFLTGILVPTFELIMNWGLIWVSLGILGAMMGVFVSLGLNNEENNSKESITQKTNVREEHFTIQKRKTIHSLYISYACEGFGYIIFGTFIVSMLTSTTSIGWHPSYIWAIVGIGAIPSCLFWSWLGNKISIEKALCIAYTLQIAGVVLPIVSVSDLAILFGALLYGGTFMGITTLTITLGKSLSVGNSQNLIGGLTSVYSIGQVFGPLTAGFIITEGNYFNAFLLSGIVLIFGLASLLITIYSRKDEQIYAIR